MEDKEEFGTRTNGGQDGGQGGMVDKEKWWTRRKAEQDGIVN